MRINVDRSSVGFTAEKSEKPVKAGQALKTGLSENTQPVLKMDELELTNLQTAVIDAVRDTNIASASELESGAERLAAIKQKLASLTDYIQKNPAEALAAQANLNPEAVAERIG